MARSPHQSVNMRSKTPWHQYAVKTLRGCSAVHRCDFKEPCHPRAIASQCPHSGAHLSSGYGRNSRASHRANQRSSRAARRRTVVGGRAQRALPHRGGGRDHRGSSRRCRRDLLDRRDRGQRLRRASRRRTLRAGVRDGQRGRPADGAVAVQRSRRSRRLRWALRTATAVQRSCSSEPARTVAALAVIDHVHALFRLSHGRTRRGWFRAPLRWRLCRGPSRFGPAAVAGRFPGGGEVGPGQDQCAAANRTSTYTGSRCSKWV